MTSKLEKFTTAEAYSAINPFIMFYPVDEQCRIKQGIFISVSSYVSIVEYFLITSYFTNRENYIFICDWGMYGKFIDYNKSIAAENFIKSSFFDIDFEKLNTTIIKNMILVYNISTNKVVDAFKAFDLPYP